MKKDFLSITDITKQELEHVLILSKELKTQLKQKHENEHVLLGKTMVLIFEKPSLRTRLSFEIGMKQLGGNTVYLGPTEIGLGKREPIADISIVTSSMADIIMARTFKHDSVVDLAKYAKVPVINGLSDLEHPCQALADMLTIWEHKKNIKGLKITFIGDGNNNVTHSLCLASVTLGMHFICSSPKEYQMNKKIVEKAKEIAKKTGATIAEIDDPKQAVENTDVVYTDTWVSMGQECEKEKRLKDFIPYQVNQDLMDTAKKDAIFMHDMPAYRGYEVTDEVIDGKQSVIFDQAENRLHAQKGLLTYINKSLLTNQKEVSIL